MPRFDLLTIPEAQARSTTGKRAQLLQEYMDYIQRVPAGEAGQLQAGTGETTNAVRRRLGAAAKATGKTLVIRRSNDTVYFWVQPGNGRRHPA
ncbi:MAG: hypothetical protein IIC95_03355 [Chloroflexi bacterium]|nr:hypothetical protein [Chloroflexota bacterium]MCH7655006.1 hypothetical protein [Chloroflexota bacterium]